MIIGVCGLIGSGKDTVADYLVTNYGYQRASFAGSLKDAVATIFNWDRSLLEGTTKEGREWREQIDPWWAAKLNMPQLSPRWVLQQWGTEVARINFHNEIWVASLENKLWRTANNVVITDCRFPNEFASIKRLGGKVVRVSRGASPDWYPDAEILNKGPNGNPEWSLAKTRLWKLKIHPSEYSSVGLKYDRIIDNNGTLDELFGKVEELVA